jgi:hypothetical protein
MQESPLRRRLIIFLKRKSMTTKTRTEAPIKLRSIILHLKRGAKANFSANFMQTKAVKEGSLILQATTKGTDSL